MSLPAYQAPNALNFEPIQQGFNTIADNALRQQQFGLEQQRQQNANAELGLRQAQGTREQTQFNQQQHAQTAAAILSLPPEQQPAALARAAASDPDWVKEATSMGFHPEDYAGIAKAMVQKGLPPQNPLDVQQKKLGIEQAQQNLENGKTTIVPMGSTVLRNGVPIATGDPTSTTLMGQDALNDMRKANPAFANQVEQMINGDLPPTNTRSPLIQKLLTAAAQVEPGFTAQQWTTRNQLRKEYSTGGPNLPAGTITAGQTAIQHIGELSDAATKLDNYQGMGLANKALNLGRNLGKDMSGTATALTDFRNIQGRFAEEATKFYRGIGGSESDIQRDLQNINDAQSPQELQTAIQAQKRLMLDKIQALQTRWKTGMGPNAKDFPIVDAKTQAALDKADANYAKAFGNSAPAPTATPAGPKYTAKNSMGHLIYSDDGKTWRETP